MTTSERIRNARKAKGMTQKELGNAIGKSSQVISNWERGYTLGITRDDIVQLANVLNVSTDYLIGTDNLNMDRDTTTPPNGLLGFLFSDEPEILNLVSKINIDGRIKLEDSVAQLTERQKDRLKDIIKMTIAETVKSGETVITDIIPKKKS